MEEFLDKLQEDHQRFSSFLLGKGPRFKAIGQAIARAHQKGRRIYLVGEPPLSQLIEILSLNYLGQFSVVPCGSKRGMKRLGREVARGDVVLAFLVDASDPRLASLLRTCKGTGAKIYGVGGIESKPFMRKVAEVLIALPTRGIKTICEGTFVTSRILARMARAALADAGAEIPRSASRRVQVMPSEESEVSDVSGTYDDDGDRLLDADELGSALSPDPVSGSRVSSRHSSPFDETGEREPASGSRGYGSRSRDVIDATAALDDSVSEDIDAGSEDIDAASEDFAPASEDFGGSADIDSLDSADEGSLPPLSDELESDVLPALDSAPVGLMSDGPSEEADGGLSFGSGILVGSDIVSAERPPSGRRRSPTSTASADPYAMEDAFLADLEMPASQRHALSSASDPGDEPRVSTRYTVDQCQLRWGRGGWPDDTAPAHQMLMLAAERLVFLLDPDDPAGSTLQKGDELWIRLTIPAFIEPLLVRGLLERISGTSGRGRGTQLALRFVGLDDALSRKLQRAAENLGAVA